jgi:GH25 family lysozyme M1 (1,4-beta-N-acetylmuramidase)
MATLKGIDISHHQGIIDWDKLKSANLDFILIRAGFGMYETQVDNCFLANIKNAPSLGIPIGIYWYSYATTRAQAEREAEVCLKTIEPYRDKITLPVFFDQEYEPGIKAAAKAVRTSMCQAFIQKIQAAGYESGLYCSYDWAKNMVDISAVPGHKWIAQYASKCQYTGSDLYIWQYSDSGRLPGISKKVDLDYGYFTLPTIDKNGWDKTGKDWRYYEQGTPVKSAWRKITGKSGTHWYYFGADGVMLTGRQTIKGKDYYLNESAFRGLPEGALWITDKDGVRA